MQAVEHTEWQTSHGDFSAAALAHVTVGTSRTGCSHSLTQPLCCSPGSPKQGRSIDKPSHWNLTSLYYSWHWTLWTLSNATAHPQLWGPHVCHQRSSADHPNGLWLSQPGQGSWYQTKPFSPMTQVLWPPPLSSLDRHLRLPSKQLTIVISKAVKEAACPTAEENHKTHLISGPGIWLNNTNDLQSSPGSTHPQVPLILNRDIPDQKAMDSLESLKVICKYWLRG